VQQKTLRRGKKRRDSQNFGNPRKKAGDFLQKLGNSIFWAAFFFWRPAAAKFCLLALLLLARFPICLLDCDGIQAQEITTSRSNIRPRCLPCG
jgi:hypothetical protein